MIYGDDNIHTAMEKIASFNRGAVTTSRSAKLYLQRQALAKKHGREAGRTWGKMGDLVRNNRYDTAGYSRLQSKMSDQISRGAAASGKHGRDPLATLGYRSGHGSGWKVRS